MTNKYTERLRELNKERDKLLHPHIRDDGKWYFEEEDGTGTKGPFDTKEEAQEAWMSYIRWLSAMDAN